MFRRVSERRILKLSMLVTVIATIGAGAGIGMGAVLRPEKSLVTPPPVPVNDIGTVSAFDGTPSAEERAIARHAKVQEDMAAITAGTEVVPDELLPGDRVGPVRVPLAHLGDADRAIWMYRTTRGKVCYGLVDFTAGCVQQLPVAQVVSPAAGDPGDGGGTIVWGFARDNVRSVNIIVNGEPQPAVVGRNAFFYQASSTAARISAVVATTAGGARVTLPVTLAEATAEQ